LSKLREKLQQQQNINSEQTGSPSAPMKISTSSLPASANAILLPTKVDVASEGKPGKAVTKSRLTK
jgi:hypothetical protein